MNVTHYYYRSNGTRVLDKSELRIVIPPTPPTLVGRFPSKL